MGGSMFFSHGNDSSQAGVAILFPRSFAQNVLELYGDAEGRILCLQLGTGANEVLLIGI